jgi:hypothetical protein
MSHECTTPHWTYINLEYLVLPVIMIRQEFSLFDVVCIEICGLETGPSQRDSKNFTR